MFLVGLDIVGDKLMEINVFSPGGLGSAQKFTKINFNRYVIQALERKANYMKFYGRNFNNVDLPLPEAPITARPTGMKLKKPKVGKPASRRAPVTRMLGGVPMRVIRPPSMVANDNGISVNAGLRLAFAAA